MLLDMMDKITQDEKINVKDILIQRDQDRKAKLRHFKEEKELLAPDQTKLFHDTFDEQSKKITDGIKLIEEKKIDQNDLPEEFSKLSKDLQVLNRYLSVSTVFLKNYSVRKSLKIIEDLEMKLKKLETELLPKKRFGFKARKSKTIQKVVKSSDEIDANTNKPILPNPTIFCGFSNRKNEILELGNDAIFKNDVELRNLEKCTVYLFGNPSTVHISSVKFCKILIGPVSTSVFVDNCGNCELVIACQQLRIHSTEESKFYIHVTSRAIIEDCSGVQFAPYNLQYEDVEKHFEMSGLDRSTSNWNKVDDFNWLASDVPSPNWKELNEQDRVSNWML